MTRPGRVEHALAEARRALARGDGLLCQSICLDLLEADVGPEAPEVTALLVTALVEAPSALKVTEQAPEALVQQVADPVLRELLRGMLAYRRALSMLDEEVPGFVVRAWLDRAAERFDAVLAIAPDHVDAVARRSLIARLLTVNPDLAARPG